jgi:hypothetical protein
VKTPIIDALIDLAPAVVDAVCRVHGTNKEILESALQSKLNSKFGDTQQSVTFISELTTGLKNFRRR